MRTGAVIAAAGPSRRTGEFTPMRPMGPLTFVQRIIASLQQADVFPIVVVTGLRADELEAHLKKLGVICLRNERYAESDMFFSAKLGLGFIRDKCDRTFFTPVDVPLFSSSTVLAMMEADAPVIKPVFCRQCGHPVLLSCELLPQILAYTGEGRLGDAITACGGETAYVEVDDAGVLHGTMSEPVREALLSSHTRQLFRPVVDVSLMREGKLFDKSGARLLHMIDYFGTVKLACEKAGMSYSKAWKLIAAMEENLGFALIDRQPGGESGGGSRLTEKGAALLTRYERYTERVRQCAKEAFTAEFQSFL